MLAEINQSHETRRPLLVKLEELLNRNVITYFTSNVYPVTIDDLDNDMIEGLDRIFAELGIFEGDGKHFTTDDLLCLLRVLVKLTKIMNIRTDFISQANEISSLSAQLIKNIGQ